MTRERLLRISRLASEAEELARQVHTGQGIRDALHLAQLAVARQLGKVDLPPAPARDEPVSATAVLTRFRAHLARAGHGAQAALAKRTALPASTLSKFGRTGQLGGTRLARLAAALDQAEREGPL